MKIQNFYLIAMGLAALIGCESMPETSSVAVRTGMTREQLKARFGEPLRIEAAAAGGEDWYYRFAGWRTRPTGEAGTSVGTDGTSTYVSAGLESWTETGEQPIHVSADGYVVGPLPQGKVVKN